MNILKEVRIPMDQSCYIQRLSYTIDGYKSILASLLGVTDFKYNIETYNKHMSEFTAINQEYLLALEELQHEYGNEFEGQMVYIKIFFATGLVQFRDSPEEGGCSCVR